MSNLPRRTFLTRTLAGLGYAAAAGLPLPAATPIDPADTAEDIFAYLRRTAGGVDRTRYAQILGAASEYKEGDEAVGVAAADEASRRNARLLLANTRIADLAANPVFEDSVSEYIATAVDPALTPRDWTLAQLKQFLLDAGEPAIHARMPGLSSDVIACAVKLMTNAELIAIGRKVFNPLPGSQIGARGYLGARIQPNSPTDHPDDIRWQVFNGFAYGVGDVVLGTNPVSSQVASVAAIEAALADVLETFGLTDAMPHCVLAHIDVQAAAERQQPGSTGIWFQSLAGVADANATFDISVEKMARHAATRSGKYGLYFETGQGADATNGHGKGFDMLLHEARKYGFARALKREVAEAQRRAGCEPAPWVHLNDVAGFIGPEIFRTREQLVRCCLEDTVMGKLHGLAIGLDICSTLHMDVDLDDLDWCIDQIMPANPAYLMALPTKNDPMLSYLTTAFQDHVRVREKFGYKVNDAMWRFFEDLGVIAADGSPGEHFGQPDRVYLAYRRRKGDARADDAILAEARAGIEQARARGVPIAEGHGEHIWDLETQLDRRVRFLYADAKQSIWAELPPGFTDGLAEPLRVRTLSADRTDYILHPPTGEVLDEASTAAVTRLSSGQGARYDVHLVISDGLNAYALTDEGHLDPYLAAVRARLAAAGYRTAPGHIVVRNGRVRAGYRIGEMLYGKIPERDSRRVVLHIIGERPGSGHHAFSVYVTAAPVRTWAETGLADHNITKVVSGIADTALAPVQAASDTLALLA